MRTTEPPFNHEAHRDALKRASYHLYELGKHDLAGACGRASAIHLQMQGRIAHSIQVQAGLERLLSKVEGNASDMQTIAKQVRRAVDTLRNYVNQPQPPWILPAGDLFPLPTGKDE